MQRAGSRWGKKRLEQDARIKGRSTLLLARVQLPPLPASRCVVPHLTAFIRLQPKELESNQQSRYAPAMAQSNKKPLALAWQKLIFRSYLCKQEHVKECL